MRKYHHLLLSLMVFLVFACGKDEKKEQPQPPIADMSTVTSAPDKRTMVGRRVEIPNAQVQQVVGTYFFWAGEQHSAIPVVRGDKLKGPVKEHVKKGDRVRISGTVRLLENVPAADPMWDKINESERRDILAALAYIHADDILVIHSAEVEEEVETAE